MSTTTEQPKKKITRIHVEWSESNLIEGEHDYPFEVFERIASRAARAVERGYDKTKIHVYWEGDMEPYVCRLDLSPHGEKGFASYVDWASRDGFKHYPVLGEWLKTRAIEGVPKSTPAATTQEQ